MAAPDLKTTNKLHLNVPINPHAQSNDFLAFLRTELVRRCKANPKYSLRAFARFLKVEPAFLSKLIAGKRRLTLKSLERFSSALMLDPTMAEKFARQIRMSKAKPYGSFDSQQDHEQSYRQLTLDQFQVIADWYHFAILELISITEFEPSTKYISRSLGISITEATEAVERLFRLNFIEVSQNGNWIATQNTTLKNPFTAAAFQKLQRQILEKAIVALEELPIEERDQTAMTLAIDSSRIQEAKEELKKFRRKFTRKMESSGRKDRVYHLGLSFYPVSCQERKK